MNAYIHFLKVTSRADRFGVNLVRISIAIVFLWIGALKFVPYEADSITPLVAQSPVMEFFYKHPEDYARHMTKEGQLVPEQRAWQRDNNTYAFSRGVGTLEILIGLLVCRTSPRASWACSAACCRFSRPSSRCRSWRARRKPGCRRWATRSTAFPSSPSTAA